MSFRTPPRIPNFDYRAPASHFVTFCTQKRLSLFSDDRHARIVSDVILDIHAADRFYLYAFCVMPDHVHLFVRLRDATVHLSRLVRLMKFRTGRAINQPGCW